jgi:hypothetical protein
MVEVNIDALPGGTAREVLAILEAVETKGGKKRMFGS